MHKSNVVLRFLQRSTPAHVFAFGYVMMMYVRFQLYLEYQSVASLTYDLFCELLALGSLVSDLSLKHKRMGRQKCLSVSGSCTILQLLRIACNPIYALTRHQHDRPRLVLCSILKTCIRAFGRSMNSSLANTSHPEPWTVNPTPTTNHCELLTSFQ